MARRPSTAGANFRAGISLDPESAKAFKRQLKELEKAVRKEILDGALMEGAQIIHDAAESRAPGPHIGITIASGRTLKKALDQYSGDKITSNTRYAAIGPEEEYWYYRFAEFGAKKHDISVRKSGLVAFQASGNFFVRAWAKMTGGVRMRPFLRPAVDNQGQTAINAMASYLRKAIEKAIR